MNKHTCRKKTAQTEDLSSTLPTEGRIDHLKENENYVLPQQPHGL